MWRQPLGQFSLKLLEQECIPEGSLPPVAVAVCGGGGVCLSACWDTPPGPLGTPQVWAWRSPRWGPGDPPGQTPQPPPWVWAWRPPIPGQTPQLPPGFRPGDPTWPDPSTFPLGVSLETPPPCEQNSCHTLLKILPCPNIVVLKRPRMNRRRPPFVHFTGC